MHSLIGTWGSLEEINLPKQCSEEVEIRIQFTCK